MNADVGIDDLVEFLEDVTRYLHSWVCTRIGEYRMCSISDVRKVLQMLMARDIHSDIIKEFKDGVEQGYILIGTMTFGMVENYKKKLYDEHRKIMKDFCKKYKYEEN